MVNHGFVMEGDNARFRETESQETISDMYIEDSYIIPNEIYRTRSESSSNSSHGSLFSASLSQAHSDMGRLGENTISLEVVQEEGMQETEV